MAFEAFRTQGEARRRPSRRRRITYAISIAVHGALLAVGVVYSFWHVEELSPPRIKVTFLSAAPPPPPPPPPAGGGGAARKKPQVKPKPVAMKTPDIVQPREVKKDEPKPEPEEKPKDEPQEKGEPGGVAGGTPGGTPGGVPGGTLGGKPGGTLGGAVGGTGTAPAAPKFLAPHMGAGQKASGEEPPFPPSLRRPGMIYRVLAKICVGTNGTVDKITIMKGADSLLDEGVVATVKTWRYRPLLANSTPVPFCYPATFEFKTQ